MTHSFTVQKIILQRREKISILEKILSKTGSTAAKESLTSQIKEQEKDLKYFENMEVTN